MCLLIDKNVVSGTKKMSAKIFGKEVRPNIRFSGKGQIMPLLVISKRLSFSFSFSLFICQKKKIHLYRHSIYYKNVI